MTDTFIRDCSNWEKTPIDLSGFAGTTHKITEGTGFVDRFYAGRVSGWRAPGRILGSYHVLHTGNLDQQLSFWIRQMDALTPWWRDWPLWINQIDAERWPDDPVSGPLHFARARGLISAAQAEDILARRMSTTVAFASMLVDAGLPGLAITYASRGQYGNSLTGIRTPLWNAAYRGTQYPGDGHADWNPYSGKTPALLQYTSTPFDKNAFRGSVADLQNFVTGGGDIVKWENPATAALVDGRDPEILLIDLWCSIMGRTSAYAKGVEMPLQVRLDALQKLIGQPVTVTLDDATRQAIVSGVTGALAGLNVGLTQATLDQIRAATEQVVSGDLAKLKITSGG